MFCFREFTLDDKEWMDELFACSDFMATDFCFTTLYLWRHAYNITVCRYKDVLLARSVTDGEPYYMYPCGRVNDSLLLEVMEFMRCDAKCNFTAPLILFSVLNSTKERLELLFPNKFLFERERETDDYIYNAESLITLKGKKLQSKRNHLARFVELPDWSYERISKENLHECLAMNSQWGSINESESNDSKREEASYTNECLEKFFELKLNGGLLRLSGRVVAFTVGEMLNSNTFIVHIEKAFANIRGAYPTISREFLRSMNESGVDFKYVSREDDAGDENLRIAKMQYNPIFLLEKWLAQEK